MRGAFEFDVLACPRCGGRLRLIALIEEAAVVDRISGISACRPRFLRRVPPARHHSARKVPTRPGGDAARRCRIPDPDNSHNGSPVGTPEGCSVRVAGRTRRLSRLASAARTIIRRVTAGESAPWSVSDLRCGAGGGRRRPAGGSDKASSVNLDGDHPAGGL